MWILSERKHTNKNALIYAKLGSLQCVPEMFRWRSKNLEGKEHGEASSQAHQRRRLKKTW